MEWVDDWELVRLCRIDKNRYFNILVRRHYGLVVNLCFRFLLDSEGARDATQDILLRVYESLDQVREKGQPFQHWLCRVATNHCRNLYKRIKREIGQNVRLDVWFGRSPFEKPPDWNMENQEAMEQVNQALVQLKLEERIALVLSEVTGLTVKEISKITKAPKYAVRRHLTRAKEKVKKILTQKLVIEDAVTK